MRTLIENTWLENSDIASLGTRFDFLEYNIMKYTMNYCKMKARLKRSRELELITQFEILDMKICDETATDDDIANCYCLKQELENITEQKAKGALVRSSLEYIEKNEKSNAYFFNKAKDTFEKKTLEIVCKDKGEQITDPQQI